MVSCGQQARMGTTMNSVPHLRERGTKRLKEVPGQDVDDLEGTLGKLSAEAATYVIETVFGQLYQSSTLGTQTRQIFRIGAEIIVQVIPNVGVVAAVNGITALAGSAR